MSLEENLRSRGGSKCELCSASEKLSVYEVPPANSGDAEACLLLCNQCKTQLEDPGLVDPNHWRCLNDSMWSPIPAVQVVAWRMLQQLKSERWPLDLLEMLYLDEETQAWAEAMGKSEPEPTQHRDGNGAALEAGDSVTLTKDLNVKGANFTAKRGTVVRGITLVSDNPEHIEGRINGQRIVILTKFVKKAN